MRSNLTIDMQPECQERGGASSDNDSFVVITTDELCTIAGNKYYIHIAGNMLRAHHVHMRNVLQQIPGLDEVKSVDKCDIILVICAVVSRAGTDIEAALNSLNKLSESKPSVLMVLHHTFDRERIVPESSNCVNRKNTLTLDILFHEDEGLLKCKKNEEALDRMQQWMLPHTEKKSWYDSFHDIWDRLKQWTNTFFSSQTDLTVASELMIVLLGISESGKTAVGNMVRKEMGKADVSTAIQNIMVERGRVAGEKVSLMDTPDWFNSGLSPEEIKENIQFCISMCSSKPYAVLLVIPVKHLTKEEEKIMENMNKILDNSCWERVMIIFSTDDQENQNIELLKQHQNVKNLMDNCGNRVYFAQTGNSAQVSDILKKIEEMVAGKEGSGDVFKLTESDMKSAIAKYEHGYIERVRNYIKIKTKGLQQQFWISKGSAVCQLSEQIDEEDDFEKV
ncbi:hypothetical protein E1301_Tti022834 [Triplophysa tibetana]|uniref:AIG1-type G domain-containing protein n=1 Tax=Triplophysa tibetana TaxID=1572043 RepID=A0A5A9P5U1_9TELE|nr:hypothetical protein E1301_Tti022834 [Triplophysa tibetana]